MIRTLVLGLVTAVWAISVQAEDVMRLAVTTSFHNSGLADVLLPHIRQDLDLEVHILVVGTGQALKLGRAGDVDAILVHSRRAEEAFVANGYGTHRREIMYNDFVVLGPARDPAGAAQATTAAESLRRIAQARADFVSRGDDSGTHRREIDLWHLADLDPERFGPWYKAVGAGMGAALNTATALDAYILSDRASWLNFGNTGTLAILFAGDPALFNQYAYVPVNPARHTHIQADHAARLEAWLTSRTARTLIDGYEIDGTPLFTFNAKP